MELRFLRPGNNFSHNLCILWSSPTCRKLAEVDVESIHCIHSTIAGEAFELSESRAVLPVLQGTFPGVVLASTILAHCPSCDILLYIFHQLEIFNLVVFVLFTLFK